ncbi:MAG: hypothetical protein ACLPXW_03630, partial [Xanthobacteraceae bacterium]
GVEDPLAPAGVIITEAINSTKTRRRHCLMEFAPGARAAPPLRKPMDDMLKSPPTRKPDEQ